MAISINKMYLAPEFVISPQIIENFDKAVKAYVAQIQKSQEDVITKLNAPGTTAASRYESDLPWILESDQSKSFPLNGLRRELISHTRSPRSSASDSPWEDNMMVAFPFKKESAGANRYMIKLPLCRPHGDDESSGHLALCNDEFDLHPENVSSWPTYYVKFPDMRQGQSSAEVAAGGLPLFSYESESTETKSKMRYDFFVTKAMNPACYKAAPSAVIETATASSASTCGPWTAASFMHWLFGDVSGGGHRNRRLF
jgi:hypothetical protein